MQNPTPIMTPAARGENLPDVPPPTPIHWSGFFNTSQSSELRDELWEHFINNLERFSDDKELPKDQPQEEEPPSALDGYEGPQSHLFLDNFLNSYNLRVLENSEQESRESEFLPMFIDPTLAQWKADISLCLEPEMDGFDAGPEEELLGVCEGVETQDPCGDLDFTSGAPSTDDNDPARKSRSPSAADMRSCNNVEGNMNSCKYI